MEKIKWYYLTADDYQNLIKPIKNQKLKYKLYSQYISRRPMLESAYKKLKYNLLLNG